MFSAVACASPGSGKSWLTLSMADDLDRSYDDVGRFSIDRVYFSASQFAQGMRKKWPRGTVHIFDDAGLSLFSREAMQHNVRDVAKIFQSVRYKNYIILLSLPALGMLDKVVRQLINAYIQPIDIDFELQRTEAKFHWMETEPMGGEIYRHKIEMLKRYDHDWLRYPLFKRNKFNSIWFDRPRKELARAYEKRKEEILGAFFEKISKGIDARETKKTQTKYIQYYNLVNSNLDKFLTEGKKGKEVDYYAILDKYPECGVSLANTIAKVLNRKKYS